MAQFSYTEIPKEIHTEFLLKQDVSSIIHHCNINKESRQICKSKYFWLNYIQKIRIEHAELLLLDIAKVSQYYIIPLFKAIISRGLDIDPRTFGTLLYFSIMRNDEDAIKLFTADEFRLYFKSPEHPLNYKDIIRSTTAVIDLINSPNLEVTDLNTVNIIFKNFFDAIDNFSYTHYIIEAIMDRFNIGSLKRLPVSSVNEVGDAINLCYDNFVVLIISILAQKSNVGDILQILRKFKEKGVPMVKYYRCISENLETSLYIYMESKLDIRMRHYLIMIKDLDHLDYIVKYPKLINRQRFIFSILGIHAVDPIKFVNIIYNANLTVTQRLHILNNAIMMAFDDWTAEVTVLFNAKSKEATK